MFVAAWSKTGTLKRGLLFTEHWTQARGTLGYSSRRSFTLTSHQLRELNANGEPTIMIAKQSKYSRQIQPGRELGNRIWNCEELFQLDPLWCFVSQRCTWCMPSRGEQGSGLPSCELGEFRAHSPPGFGTGPAHRPAGGGLPISPVKPISNASGLIWARWLQAQEPFRCCNDPRLHRCTSHTQMVYLPFTFRSRT
jgi:hypothetical protein